MYIQHLHIIVKPRKGFLRQITVFKECAKLGLAISPRHL